MTIVAQIQVESRRFSGWLDPRYPIGYWQAALVLTGDASGGVLGIDLLFQTANGPARLNSQMYSVERFSVSTSQTLSKTMALLANNMGGPANEGFDHEYGILLGALDGGGAAITPQSQNLVPWFLGSQRTAGQTASLSLVTDNVLNAIVKLEAEGYRWSPRSVLIDGGPQRPPTGPYRS